MSKCRACDKPVEDERFYCSAVCEVRFVREGDEREQASIDEKARISNVLEANAEIYSDMVDSIPHGTPKEVALTLVACFAVAIIEGDPRLAESFKSDFGHMHEALEDPSFRAAILHLAHNKGPVAQG